jgi:CO/xanthine dehydrogenase FAD-binding subunit
LFPVLLLLGAQLEIRGGRTARWVATQELVEKGSLVLGTGELVSRVRLPLEPPGLFFYQKIGSFRSAWDERLSMVCLASQQNGLLSRFRLAFSLPHVGVLRPRELEAQLPGRRLPLPLTERERLLERLDSFLGEMPVPASVFQRERVLHLTRWVLTRLEED